MSSMRRSSGTPPSFTLVVSPDSMLIRRKDRFVAIRIEDSSRRAILRVRPEANDSGKLALQSSNLYPWPDSDTTTTTFAAVYVAAIGGSGASRENTMSIAPEAETRYILSNEPAETTKESNPLEARRFVVCENDIPSETGWEMEESETAAERLASGLLSNDFPVKVDKFIADSAASPFFSMRVIMNDPHTIIPFAASVPAAGRVGTECENAGSEQSRDSIISAMVEIGRGRNIFSVAVLESAAVTYTILLVLV